jgi:hypothetical protein
MSEGAQQNPAEPDPRNPSVAFEPRDVNIRGIVWFAIGLAILIAVSVTAVFGIYAKFAGEQARKTRSEFPVAEAARQRAREADPAGPLPPPPRLGALRPLPPGQPAGRMFTVRRGAPGQDDEDRGRREAARVLHDAQQGRLDSWGWSDKDKTTAHIPIGEAISRLLAKPGDVLKERPGSQPVDWDAQSTPRETNSGRAMAGGDK